MSALTMRNLAGRLVALVSIVWMLVAVSALPGWSIAEAAAYSEPNAVTAPACAADVGESGGVVPGQAPEHATAQIPGVAPAQIPAASQPPMAGLRFDGLYKSHPEEPDANYCYYLRFYPDGTVMSVSSSGTPQEVSRWLQVGNHSAGIGIGAVEQDGLALRFSLRSNLGVTRYGATVTGVVDVVGTVGVDQLTLESYSHINGLQATRLYHFVPIEGW